MSDMIQINIQAILDAKSEEQILASIENIRIKVANSPFVLKVQTDSEALNAFASKIQTLSGEANRSLQITPNINSNATKIIQTYNDEFTTLTRTIEETKLGIGQLQQVITSLDAESGDMVVSGSKIITNFDQQRIAGEKLIVTQTTLRNVLNSMSSVPISAKSQVINAENLISGLNINSSVIDQQKAKLAVEAVTNAYKEQKVVEDALVSAQNELNKLKDQELSKQQNLYDFSIRQQELQQQINSNLIRQQMQEQANLDAEKLKTAELQRQVTLYQEQNALAIRNMQAQYGSLARTPAIQSQIGAVQGAVAGLSSSVLDAEGFRTQTASINTSLRTIRTGLNEARAASNNFANDLGRNAVKMVEWTVVGGLIFGTLRQIKEGFSFINDLNTSMTNIAMITGKSHDSIVQMTKDYSDLASQLHETTSEIMTASEEFLRAGNSAEETGKLLEASTVMSKIAGQSQQDSAKSMISIMNAYHMSAEEMMGVVDKMVAVDNTSATSTAELSAAIQKTAASAQASGVSFSELVSWIGEVSSVSRQSADTIGTAFNSIFSRYENVKAKVLTDENGESLNNVEKVLNNFGIAIRDQQNNFLSFNDVLTKVANNWNNYNGVEQGAIATAMAGTRQHNQFLILMQNFNKTLELQTTEADSAGNALNRFGEYGKSTQAKLADLSNTVQQLWMKLISSDAINSAVTGITNFVSTIDHVTSTFGGLSTAIYVTVAALVILKNQAIGNAITSLISLGTQVLATSTFFGGVFPASLFVAEMGLQALSATMVAFFTNPVTWLIGGLALLTTGLVTYANHQAKVKAQLEETTKAQVSFNDAIQQFQNTLDPKKIDDMATALENMKKATNYDESIKNINQLKTEIADLETKIKGEGLSTDISKGLTTDVLALDAKKKKLAELEAQTGSVVEAQKKYDEEQKIAISLDYKSVQTLVQKQATTLKEIASQDQLVKKYQEVYDKLSKGIEITKDESDLNQQMIDKYPQYVKVLNDKTGAIGIDSNALKSNLSIQQALAITELESIKQTASAREIETQAIIDSTEQRIKAMGAEIEAIQAVNQAYTGKLNSTSGAEYDELRHIIMMNDQYMSQSQQSLITANNQLNEAKLTKSAWDTLSNLNPEDLLKDNSGGSFMPPESGSKTKKSPSTTAQDNKSFKDAEDAIIAIVNAKAKLTDQNNKLIQSQIDESKNLKDYNDVLTHTKELIAGQQQQVKDLQNANSQLHWEYNHQAELGGFDTSKWFNSDGEQSLDFVRQYNQVDSETQKKMEATYSTLQKLQKSWQSNDAEIVTLTADTTKLSSTLPQIQFDIVTAKIQTFTDSINELNTQLDLSKARQALTTEGSSEYGRELVNQTKIYEDLITQQKNSITYMQQELQDTNLSIDAKQELTKSIQEATKSLLGYQLAIQQTAQSLATQVVNGEKAIAQAQLDSQEQALEAYKTTHQAIIDGYQAQLDSMQQVNEANQEAITQQDKLNSLNQASLDLAKAEQELANAENQKNTRIYVAGQGWTWQANPNDVQKAQDSVDSAYKALQKQQEDYNNWQTQTQEKHQEQLLKDQIKSEQDLIQDQQNNYDKSKKLFDDQWKDIQTLSQRELDKFNGNLDTAIDSLTTKLATINSKLAEIANANANLANAVAGSDSSNNPSNNSNNSSSNSTTSSTSGSSSSIVSGISSVASVVSSIGHMLGFADGTENVPKDGLYKTSEKGAELTYLNKGSAVIPADFTKNILAFGANPLNYMQNILSNISLPKIPSFSPIGGMGGNMDNSITIQNMNVTTPNAKDFMNQMNNLRFMTNNQYR